MPIGLNRKLNRLKGYDYSRTGWYFITICVKNRIECLGKIEKGEMFLSERGKIIFNVFEGIPKYYQNVALDEWVVMPNHIHGIIVIENDIASSVGTEKFVGTEQCSVPTDVMKNINYGLLSKIVKSFKDVSIKNIHRQLDDFEFSWQRSFYDHIIRNQESLDGIRHYIQNNPRRWELDRNNKENLYI